MKNFIALSFSIILLTFFGCSEENPYLTSTEQDKNVTDLYREASPSENPQGECPNIFYESLKILSNDVVVTWTSSFAEFDYTKGADSTVTVRWSVVPTTASVTFVSLYEKKKVWTPPKDVNKDINDELRWSFNYGTGDSLDLTVKMDPMHRAIDPDWKGYIGNGHFKLELKVDGIKVKLGVNVHLEDPDDGFTPRCPEI